MSTPIASASPSAAFFDAVLSRRSIYHITSESTITDAKVVEIVQTAVKHAPSAFNSQNFRAVVVFGDQHRKIWDHAIAVAHIRSPSDEGKSLIEKIKGAFQAGHGTILFFEDQEIIKTMQDRTPPYKDHFPQWSAHASGMTQYIIWVALEKEGLGASLQHLNPLIDADVQKDFDLPESWKLVAQMPFGKPSTTTMREKQFAPIEERVKVVGGDL